MHTISLPRVHPGSCWLLYKVTDFTQDKLLCKRPCLVKPPVFKIRGRNLASSKMHYGIYNMKIWETQKQKQVSKGPRSLDIHINNSLLKQDARFKYLGSMSTNNRKTGKKKRSQWSNLAASPPDDTCKQTFQTANSWRSFYHCRGWDKSENKFNLTSVNPTLSCEKFQKRHNPQNATCTKHTERQKIKQFGHCIQITALPVTITTSEDPMLDQEDT